MCERCCFQREQIRLHQLALEMKLTPFLILLRHTMDALEEFDPTGIFAEPVSLKEVKATSNFSTIVQAVLSMHTGVSVGTLRAAANNQFVFTGA